LGRLLFMKETNERGLAEVQRIVEVTKQILVKAGKAEKELRESLLDILRYLPVRASDEIAFVCQQVEDIASQEVQEALLVSLSYARPDEEALPVLQALTSSSNTQIAQTAQIALGRKSK
jgi:hypothetical protein